MKNSSKLNTEDENVVQLLSDDEVESEFGVATAAVAPTDKAITWAKFVLTDNKPNGNNQRIPDEEFESVIRTGLYKPVKMGLGEIKDGHDGAKPLGVITNLKREGDVILGLAALWDHERSGDVSMVKKAVNSGKPVNVSWELLYGRKDVIDGVENLRDIILTAATIVGIPAYAGRTQFIAVAASKKWSQSYIDNLPETSFLFVNHDGSKHFAYRDADGKIATERFSLLAQEIAESNLPQNTLKNIRHQLSKMNSVIKADAALIELVGEPEMELEEQKLNTELENKISELETKLADAVAALNDMTAKFEQANASVIALNDEIVPLREFKAVAEQKAQREAKILAIRGKFETASIAKSEEYFADEAKLESLLKMDDAALDFMIQELTAFAEQLPTKEEAGLHGGSGIPNLTTETDGGSDLSDPKNLAAALRDNKNKK